MTPAVPEAQYGLIGGSSTFSINFPEDLERPDLEVLGKELVFSTPYGNSPEFKLFKGGIPLGALITKYS
ncbi:MAG: hypothetical protein M0021_04655 [Clostridia bacterium]|nr:hypothetical protein [Clostridia bacterium]